MSKQLMLFHSFFIFLSMVIYGKSFSEPVNVSIAKQQAIHYHDSGEYSKDLNKVFKKAEHYIVKKTQFHKDKNPAIVLDIDETCLSNYENIIARDFTGTMNDIHQHILKADSKPIPACKHLFELAKDKDIDVFFITGRFENERQATIKNLHAAGISGWKGLFLQPNSNFNKKNTIEGFKIATRQLLEKQGHHIIASIGDQYVDLSCGYAEHMFKLPNPFYYIKTKGFCPTKAA